MQWNFQICFIIIYYFLLWVHTANHIQHFRTNNKTASTFEHIVYMKHIQTISKTRQQITSISKTRQQITSISKTRQQLFYDPTSKSNIHWSHHIQQNDQITQQITQPYLSIFVMISVVFASWLSYDTGH